MYEGLFPLLFIIAIIQCTTAQKLSCDACVQSICSSSGGNGCTFIQQPNDTCISTSCNAERSNSIIRCNGTIRSLLQVAELPQVVDNSCVENRTYPTKNLDIRPGFYIVGNNLRFCSNRCFTRILIGSIQNPNLPSSENPIQFHVYKRYTDQNMSSYYFVEQQRFNISLSHNTSESVYEATPIGPSVCVDSGDYVGMTLTEDIGLVVGVDGVVSSDGSYVNQSPSPQCSGITAPVFNLGRLSDGPVPMINFVAMTDYTTTMDTTPAPSTFVTTDPLSNAPTTPTAPATTPTAPATAPTAPATAPTAPTKALSPTKPTSRLTSTANTLTPGLPLPDDVVNLFRRSTTCPNTSRNIWVTVGALISCSVLLLFQN